MPDKKIGKLGVGWDGGKGSWGEKSKKGRMVGGWGNGMIGRKEVWIEEQGIT